MALETVNKNTAVKFKLGRNNGRISTKMSEIDKICLERYSTPPGRVTVLYN